MRYILRDYQKACIDAISDAFCRHETQLVQLPTGSGKTVIIWKFLHRVGWRGIVIAPTIDLVEQLKEKAVDILGPVDGKDHLVLTQQSLFRRLESVEWSRYDVLIIDEAHHSGARTYGKIIEEALNNDLKVLGLTATPERMDGISLLNQFEILSFKRNFLDLIEQGHLCDLFCYRVKTNIRVESKKRNMQDFSQSSLRLLDIPSRNKIIVDTCLNESGDKKTLVFCLNIHHAREIDCKLKAAGKKSRFIHGEISKMERASILKSFKNDEFQYLCGVQLLCEGFDEPSIEALVLGRPTKSKALYCQMIGRGVRPYPGKKGCYVYDLSDDNHNICSFNVLGAEKYDKSQFENLVTGEKLTELISRIRLQIQADSHEYEAFDIFSNLKELSDVPRESQLMYLENCGLDRCLTSMLSFSDCCYLIWKTEKFRQYGFDSKKYWQEWCKL